MSTFMDRLLLEQTELNEKKTKLGEFLQSEGFNNIALEQQYLLKIQHRAMETYSECLKQRIIQINSVPESHA